MAEKRYNVVFEGAIAEGRDPDEVRKALAEVLELSAEEAECFLLDEPTVVATNTDKDNAMRLRLGFIRAGAECSVIVANPDEIQEERSNSGPWKETACPHCGTKQLPARECKHCGQRMKKPTPA